MSPDENQPMNFPSVGAVKRIRTPNRIMGMTTEASSTHPTNGKPEPRGAPPTSVRSLPRRTEVLNPRVIM